MGHLDVVLSKLGNERGGTAVDSSAGSQRFSSQDAQYVENLVKRYSNAKENFPRSVATLDTTVL